ncbi:hypothetical protein N9T73_00465 [bacterium]|nr:hypothetical protein [bacterium]
MFKFKVIDVSGSSILYIIDREDISIRELKMRLIIDDSKFENPLMDHDMVNYKNINLTYIIDVKKIFQTNEELVEALKDYNSNENIELCGLIADW